MPRCYATKLRATPSRTRPTAFVGGGFTSPGFGIDEVAAAIVNERDSVRRGAASPTWIDDDVDRAAAAELQRVAATAREGDDDADGRAGRPVRRRR